MKTLILIDGHALAYRQYFALERTSMSTTDGQPTWAIYGFFKTIFDLLKNKKYKPDAIAVTFDLHRENFRTEIYQEYKAQRESMPDNMRSQMSLIQDGLKAFNIPVYTKENFEADDVIGTISKKASELGCKTYILTGDQDSFQLVDKEGSIGILIPYKGEITEYDWDKVYEKFGVYPNQIIDYKALCGDNSDNIPGVKGVGVKSTQKLLAEYQNLENLYKNIDSMPKSALKNNLIDGKDTAFLCQKLATIVRDVDIDFDFDKACIEAPNTQQVIEFFQTLQFHSFIRNIKSIFSLFESNCEIKPVMNTTMQLGLFASMEEPKEDSQSYTNEKIQTFDGLIKLLQNTDKMSFITEVMENDRDIISSITFGLKENNTLKTHTLNADVDLKQNLELLKPVLENENIKKVLHNSKFEYTILKKYGINLSGIEFDTMLASYVKDPSRKHDISVQALENLNFFMSEENNDDEKIYAIFKMADYWKTHLDEKELNLLYNVEIPLSTILANMEMQGVAIDTDYLKSLSNEFETHLKSLENTIYNESGESFNINSPKQVSDILYNKLEITPVRTGKNKFSTSADVLQELSFDYEICKNILEYRKYAKLKSTYTDALPNLISPIDGKIHTSFNQTVTTTGRLSSSDPNLQNIPTRTEESSKIRKAFVPEDKENQVLLSADYSQIELRLLAHCSGEEKLIKAFNNDEDIHTQTASKIFEVAESDVTKEMRRKAKAVNFGIIYGQSGFGLAKTLDIDVKTASLFIKKYFETYPKVKEYMEKTKAFAHEHGYVETIFGRKRYLATDLNSSNKMIKEAAERAAINQPLQGTAADLIKMAMNTLYGRLTKLNLKSKIILQVHDELIIETFNDELDIVKTIVKDSMELNQPLSVPLVVDIAFGKNWVEL